MIRKIILYILLILAIGIGYIAGLGYISTITSFLLLYILGFCFTEAIKELH